MIRRPRIIGETQLANCGLCRGTHDSGRVGAWTVAVPDTRIKAYNGLVAEPGTPIDGIQHEATAEDAAKFEEYFRGKLDLAVSLACHGEQERRSRHQVAAEEYRRQWEQVISELKRLLPLVRKSGVPLLATESPLSSCRKRR